MRLPSPPAVWISLLWISLLCLPAAWSAPAHAAAPARPPGRTLEIGAAAPGFRLKGVDDRTYTLDSFAKSPILAIIFTCNHCPTACAYEKRILELHRDYRERGVAIVAISPNDPQAVRLDELGWTDLGDSLEEMKIRARHKKFTFPYLYDGDEQKAARAYGPKATPHVFVFDEARRLRYVGRVDDSESGRSIRRRDARNAIDALLAGRPVPVETTRPVGCSIKWSEKRANVAAFMKRLAAEKVSLESIDAKGVDALRANPGKKHLLVNVWATYCGPCVREFPDLVTTYRMYRHREFDMATITVDSSAQRSRALEFLKERQASNPSYIYASEDREPLAKALDEEWSGALPLTLLIAPGGKIVFRHEGAIDPIELRRTIVKHLPAWR